MKNQNLSLQIQNNIDICYYYEALERFSIAVRFYTLLSQHKHRDKSQFSMHTNKIKNDHASNINADPISCKEIISNGRWVTLHGETL